jgi:hypothetical protein
MRPKPGQAGGGHINAFFIRERGGLKMDKNPVLNEGRKGQIRGGLTDRRGPDNREEDRRIMEKENEALQRIADAVLVLSEAGYILMNFRIDETGKTDMNGQDNRREITINLVKDTGHEVIGTALEVPGLFEKLARSYRIRENAPDSDPPSRPTDFPTDEQMRILPPALYKKYRQWKHLGEELHLI